MGPDPMRVVATPRMLPRIPPRGGPWPIAPGSYNAPSPPETTAQPTRIIMARRTVNLRELRAQAEAAERLGLNTPPERKRRSEPTESRPKPEAKSRMKVVWAVCDVGGRTIQTFDYADKAAAEALAAERKARTRDNHFVRAEKVPM